MGRKKSQLWVLGHSVYRTEYHIVWIPEYCRRILNPGVRGYLYKLFRKVMKQLPGCEIMKMNIQVDHIHVLIIIPPKYPKCLLDSAEAFDPLSG